MPVQFFGQYLVTEGVIDRSQLRRAVEHMQDLHRTLGELAEHRGFMTPDAVERVLAAQLESDARFGDVAMELGCLTQLELDELIEDQLVRQVRIGESLVELGHVEASCLKELVDRFEREQAELTLRDDRIPPALRESAVALDVLDRAPRTALRATLLPLKLGVPKPWSGDTPHHLRFSITIDGDSGATVGIAANPTLAKELAAGRLGNHAPTPEIIDDVVSAYLRTVAQLSARGRTLGEVTRALPEAGFAVPIASPTGQGVLVLDPA